MNNFETIDSASLDTVTGGGGIGTAIKKGAAWAWRNVIAPAGGGALYDWATGGNRQPQQPAPQPQQGQ